MLNIINRVNNFTKTSWIISVFTLFYSTKIKSLIEELYCYIDLYSCKAIASKYCAKFIEFHTKSYMTNKCQGMREFFLI